MSKDIFAYLQNELDSLAKSNNLRKLPEVHHDNNRIIRNGNNMLNISSNDYLGLASDVLLRNRFLEECRDRDYLFTASSSRLLTGNYTVYDELEQHLVTLYGSESALVFNCGYHANTGILPAIADAATLVLADKLVHASIIDGLKLTDSKNIRFRHNNYEQLERLLAHNAHLYDRIIIVVESVYSMDGDLCDLLRIVALKKQYDNVLLYVDEAHGVGVFGQTGLGLAQECGCIKDVDFIVGTFGKALASTGAYVICRSVVREYLINKMRPLIFTTALPPVNIAWTKFIMENLYSFEDKRKHLRSLYENLIKAVKLKTGECNSQSQIIPFVAGESEKAVEMSVKLQKKGFYVLPVRPPTVPQGTSRLRFSLTASITKDEMDRLTEAINQL